MVTNIHLKVMDYTARSSEGGERITLAEAKELTGSKDARRKGWEAALNLHQACDFYEADFAPAAKAHVNAFLKEREAKGMNKSHGIERLFDAIAWIVRAKPAKPVPTSF